MNGIHEVTGSIPVWSTILSFSSLDSPQVAEGRCGYAGSNKAFSVERDSVGKEQLLEPLSLFEGRLHPEVGGARQNAFCERQDALYVEFIELAGVTVDPRERELLAQFLGVAVVRLDVDRALEEECFVETVQLVLNRLCSTLSGRDFLAHGRFPSLPDLQNGFLE